MAHITSTGSGKYTLLYNTAAAVPADTDTQAEWEALTWVQAKDVQEMPPVGAPANIVNVPVYGKAISDTVSGQADAPTVEFTLNWYADAHEALQGYVDDGITHGFRLRVMNSVLIDPDTPTSAEEHDDFYFGAQVASFVVTPALDGANTAVVTLSLKTSFDGPYTTT